ncbi:MAG: nitroreductase [Hyphomonas sp.]
MDVSQAVDQRISTRAFLPTPLSKADVTDWLEKAQRSPSGGNLQAWRSIVLTGDALSAVATLASAALAENPKGEPTDRSIYPADLWNPLEARRRRVGEMMYEALDIPKEDRAARVAWFANNFRFFGAPLGVFIILDTRVGHGQWAHAGMYAQTLALLAEERGWGTCFQECWGMLRPSLKKHLNLADTEMVWTGMSVGVPDPHHPVNTLRAERAPLSEIVDLRGF